MDFSDHVAKIKTMTFHLYPINDEVAEEYLKFYRIELEILKKELPPDTSKPKDIQKNISNGNPAKR
tara:strand:+ start:574 stop:771 length:198 start_codon:yes stop_codon:yes gene_type:complete